MKNYKDKNLNVMTEAYGELRNDMDDLITIELDVAYDKDISEVGEFAQEHGVEYKIIEEHGPGGGWPVVQFTGNKENMKNLVLAYADGDIGMLDDFIDCSYNPKECEFYRWIQSTKE